MRKFKIKSKQHKNGKIDNPNNLSPKINTRVREGLYTTRINTRVREGLYTTRINTRVREVSIQLG